MSRAPARTRTRPVDHVRIRSIVAVLLPALLLAASLALVFSRLRQPW